MKTLLIALALSAPLNAVCIAPDGYAVRVERTEVVVVHVQGRQETLIRITPVFDGTPADRLAWIILIPGPPTDQGVADEDALYAGFELHSRLFGLARDQWANRTEYEWPEALTWLKKRDPPPPAAAPRDVPTGLEPAALTLTPIPESGTEGVVRLVDWLAQLGLPAPPPDELERLAESGFSFLCVLVQPQHGRVRLGKAVEVSPVRVCFTAQEPFLPAGAGIVDCAIITDRPLATLPYLQARESTNAETPSHVLLLNLWSLKPLAHSLGAAAPAQRWYVNRMRGAAASSYAAVSLPLGDLRDELPGFWYYGDDDISFAERFFREHILAVTTSFFLFGVLFLVFKNRRRQSSPADRT